MQGGTPSWRWTAPSPAFAYVAGWAGTDLATVRESAETVTRAARTILDLQRRLNVDHGGGCTGTWSGRLCRAFALPWLSRIADDEHGRRTIVALASTKSVTVQRHVAPLLAADGEDGP